MRYKVVTAATTEPVSLADARLHLRLSDDETAEDTLIDGLISAAREYAEHYTGRALAQQTLEMALDAFPAVDRRAVVVQSDDLSIVLAQPPVQTVSSITYVDPLGATQTLATSAYALSQYGESRRVNLAGGATEWPQTKAVADAVQIQYVTGAADVPRAARAAILLLVGHLFENRQEAVVDLRAAAVQIPLGAKALLDTLTVWSA